VIGRIAEGDKEDIDLAVTAARDAFDHGPWPRLPGSVCTLSFFDFSIIINQHVTHVVHGFLLIKTA
jgi:coniferyl-aldehyde dehydrogenase